VAFLTSLVIVFFKLVTQTGHADQNRLIMLVKKILVRDWYRRPQDPFIAKIKVSSFLIKDLEFRKESMAK
jgi:hypothetical protein